MKNNNEDLDQGGLIGQPPQGRQSARRRLQARLTAGQMTTAPYNSTLMIGSTFQGWIQGHRVRSRPSSIKHIYIIYIYSSIVCSREEDKEGAIMIIPQLAHAGGQDDSCPPLSLWGVA